MGNNQSNFANKALQKLAKNENIQLLVVPSIDTKQDKPTKEEPKKYANEYEEYIKTWEPGDLIPLLPPGGKFNFCRFHPTEINDGDGFYTIYGKRQSRIEEKDLSSSQEIEYKVLGKKLKDSIDSLLARAARTRGLWVDDKNKLRCPPGSPAANQFTDMSGSNCLIPSPKTAVQSGARAARRVGQAVAQSGAVGARTAQSFDAARATQEQIRELGFEKVQEMMAIGGRIVAPYDQAGVSGSIRDPLDILLSRGGARPVGITAQPRKIGKGRSTGPSAAVAYRLGLKEQIYRGRRATELADNLNQRIIDPTTHKNGIFLPSGKEIGDLRQKDKFVAAMKEAFPNVDENEFGELFDNFIPANLSYIQKLKLKEAYVPFFQTLIYEAISNPERAAWMTQMNIDLDDSSAFRVDMTPFSPSLDSGGRTPSIGSQKFASKFGGASYETGAMHFSMNINPYSMLTQATGSSSFNKDGRSSGVRDTMQGDMHYIATHEFGHIAHFAGVMNALGFDTANLARYPDVTQLVPNPKGGAASRQPERGVGAWIIDFRQARNPLGSQSIQALIDAATRLQTNRAPGYRNYTRAEVERDLKNFHYGFSEAVENNITDTAEQRALMLEFAGGEYATQDNQELRAEFYASRRLYADEKQTLRPGLRTLTGGLTTTATTWLLGAPKPGVNTLEAFATAMATKPNTPYQPADIIRILDDAGQSIYGINPNNWNISGRMASSTPVPSLKTRAIRNSVNQNNRQTRQQSSGAGSISGRMRGGEVAPRLVPSRVFKEQDTFNDEDLGFPNTPGRRESLTALSPLMQSLNTGPARGVSGSMSDDKKKKDTPQFPRMPAYGPMLGKANEIFDGVTSWEEFKSRYDDQEVVFLDYETTGLVFDEFNRSSGNGATVQIGAVKSKGGQVTDRFNVFVNPNMQKSEWEEWSRNSLKGPNGEPLTDEFLADKPSIAEAHRMLAEFAGPNALMGVQNAAFDKNVLDDALRDAGIEWRPAGWIDLKDMAAMTLPRYSAENPDGPHKIDRKTGEKVPSSSLKEITKYLGVELGDKHHNADADAEATAESMRKLIDGAIEKQWSLDALNPARRAQYVATENQRFDDEVKAFEKQLAEYKQTSISGKMASDPKNAMILSGVDGAETGSMVGRNQTKDYYKSVPRRFKWKQETLEGSERQRINNRKRILSDLTEFLQSGGDDERANDLQELTNGLDPRFFDYIKNSDERTLLSDLRQASIEFHSGIDVQPVVSITPSEINDILDSGFKFNKNATPITKIYHADIGIHPETPDELRPIVAQIIHTDTTKDEDNELASIFGKFDELEILSGRRNFKFLNRGLARKNRDSLFGYGEAEVKLRSSVAERTSYGNGSAIHNHIFPVNTLSDEPDAIGRALIDSVGRGDKRDENVIELLYGKFKGNFNSYRTDNGKTRPGAAGRWQERDALILGGIDPEDIEEISIPFNMIDMTNAESPSRMINRLNADGALGFNPEELQILTNIGSGIDAERAIPKNIAVRMNGLFKYNALSTKLENLARVDQANILKSKADSMAVDLVFTNRFGLNIFNGDAFDARAASGSDSREVLRKKSEKIMKEIVTEMRKVKKELGDNNNTSSKISGSMGPGKAPAGWDTEVAMEMGGKPDAWTHVPPSAEYGDDHEIKEYAAGRPGGQYQAWRLRWKTGEKDHTKIGAFDNFDAAAAAIKADIPNAVAARAANAGRL